MDNEDWAREEIAQYERANQLIIRKNHAKSGNQAHHAKSWIFLKNDKNGTYILLFLSLYARCAFGADNQSITSRKEQPAHSDYTHTHTEPYTERKKKRTEE